MINDAMPPFRDPGESDEDYAARLGLLRRLTPQEFVRDNPVSDEAADLMDEMIAQGRRDGEAPFGI